MSVSGAIISPSLVVIENVQCHADDVQWSAQSAHPQYALHIFKFPLIQCVLQIEYIAMHC